MRTDTEELERKFSADNRQLLKEYQLLWRHHGFSYPAFLRWRCATRHLQWGVSAWTPHDTNAAVISRFDCDFRGVHYEPEYAMVNPDWANLWADLFGSVDEALEWHRVGIGAAGAVEMKRIGYRSPHRAVGMHDLIMKNGWLPVLQDRTDIKVPIHHDIHSRYSSEADAAIAVTALALNPEFNFTAGQVKAFREYINLNNIWSSTELVQACSTIANLCGRITDLGWSIPNGNGVFSFITRLISESPPHHSRLLHMAIRQCDGDEAMFTDVINLMADTHWEDAQLFLSERNLIRMVYSVKTGVPYEWVDDDICDGVISGDIPEMRWVDQYVLEARWTGRYSHDTALQERVNQEADRLRSEEMGLIMR